MEFAIIIPASIERVRNERQRDQQKAIQLFNEWIAKTYSTAGEQS